MLLRSVVYFVAMTVSVVPFGLVIIVFGRFLPGGFSDRVASAWGLTNLRLLDVICGLSYRVVGAENIPATPCVIMAKHQSTWETIALRGLLRPQQSWVLKKELLTLPIFGWGLRFVKSIPIDRAAGRRAVFKVVDDGKARLAEGRDVIIFPEGTRTAPGERRRYGVGGGVLAQRAGVPVVPIAHNAGVYWRRRGVQKYPGEIQVIIGKPFDPKGRKAADIVADVEEWIEATVEKLPNSVHTE